MKRLSFLILVAALPALAVDFDGVLSWRIPEGEVARVEVGGEVVWPIIPYVTNGLVAYWDGVWNAGVGVHDATAEKPEELVSGLETTLSGTIQAEDNAFLLGSGNLQFNLPAIIPAINEGHATVEIVLAKHGTPLRNGGYLAVGGNNTRGFWFWQREDAIFSACSYHARREYNEVLFDTPATNSFAFQLTAATTNTCFLNGAPTFTITRFETALAENSTCCIGRLPGYSSHGVAKVFAIRIYDRALADAEIARNAAIDAARFGFDVVEAASTPAADEPDEFEPAEVVE